METTSLTLVPPPPLVPAARNENEPIGDAVLDVDDIAALLRVGRNTVYDLVARNELPHRRLGKQIRFSRAAVMRWLDPWSSQGAAKGR